MRVLVLSDTHIPERASHIPEAFWKQVSKEEIILHAGDFTDLAVLKELEKKAKHVHAVWGNMDGREVRAVLPEKQMIDIGEYRIGMYHGSGPPHGLEEKVYKMFPEGLAVIVFGHSHSPYNKKIKKTLMFNPGSISWNQTGPPTYGILHLEKEGVWGEIVEIKT
jgi:hypothetical protein